MGDTNIESNQPTEEEVSVSLTAEEVVARLTSSSRKVRLESLDKLSNLEFATPELVVDGIFSTLLVYSDSKSLMAVETLIKKLLAKASTLQDLKYFLGNLRKATIASLKAISSSSYEPRIALFRWHCIFFEASLSLVAGETAALSLLISNQSSLLNAFLDVPKSIRNHVFHRFSASLQKPDVFQLYIKQVLEEEPTTTHIILVGLLLSHLKAQPAKLAPYKAKFLEWYTKVTLAAVTQPHYLSHELFVPLLNSLDNSDFSASITPVLARSLKRSPEVAAWNTATMFSLISNKNIDSALLKDSLLPVVFPLLLGSSDKLRPDAINVLRQLIRNTKTSAGFISIITEVTKQSPLQFPYQRAAVFSVLLSASERFSSPHEIDVNASLAPIIGLIPLIEKEANEEAKSLGIRLLGAWSKFVPSIPEPILKSFGTQIKLDKEVIRAATVEAIEQAVSKPENGKEKTPETLKVDSDKSQQIVVLVDSILSIIKNAKTPKLADTSSPVSAVRLLTKLASVNSTIDGKLDKAFWQTVFTGFLFQPSYLTRLNEKESISFLQLLETILLLSYQRIKNVDPSFFSSYVFLLTHPLWAVRRAAVQTTLNLHPQLPKLSDLLVSASVKFVNESSATATIVQNNANNPNNNNTSSVSLPPPTVLSTAISASASPSLSDNLIPSLFAAAHLPYVDSHAWQNTSKSLAKISGDLLQKESMAKAVVDYLTSAEILLSKDANFQQAGTRGLATAARYSGDTIIPQAITQLQELLSTQRLDAISANDVAVYNTPEGELYEKVENEYVPKVREAKVAAAPKEHRKRGERGLYSKADLAYEEKLRKELEEKKKKEEEVVKPKFTEAELKVLAKESKVRASVAEARHSFACTLEALRSVVSANLDISHGYLRTFMEIIIPVVSHPLTSSLSFPALKALAMCMQAPMQTYGHPAAHLILSIYSPASQNPPEPESIDFTPENFLLMELQKVLGVARSLAKPMGASSFAFLFPILKSCLEKTYSFVIQDAALEVVQLHLNHGGNYPRGAMIASLASVVAASPRLEPRAKAGIIALGSSLRIVDMTHACSAFVSEMANVRHAVLSALEKTPGLISSTFPELSSLTTALWAGRYDDDATNAALADTIWKKYSHPLAKEATQYLDLFLPHLNHAEKSVRHIFAGAIAGAMRTYPESAHAALSHLFTVYVELLPVDGERENDTAVNIQFRNGISAVAGKAADVLQGETLSMVFDWMIGVSLGDSEESVNQELVLAGMEIVNAQGKVNQALMFSIFEKFLAKGDTGSRRQDQVRESVIVFMGVLAQHVVGDEARVTSILARLVDALKTPSELVQQAVSKCLTQLMPSIKQSAPALMARLVKTLRDGKGGYAALRGAAYGLAGAVKGLGVIALKQYDVLTTLGAALEDKKSMGARQGGLLAYECLSNVLCRGFEPYVQQILPRLLTSFGDNSNEVRLAASAAAKKIMGQLTPFGVKTLLPVLLKPLEDKNSTWRTKEGSVELLGAMAFCAPKQLSQCLPTIVPRLVEVLTDTHEAVQKATREALSHVGSVIRNPEVQMHVRKVLRALYDHEATKEALDALLNTNFVHIIDAPSLSLLMPILDRGLRDRATETKKRAAQIVGNMCSLTDPQDLVPYHHKYVGKERKEKKRKEKKRKEKAFDSLSYLGVLIPDLKTIVTDPIPDVRTMGSVAMGSLVSGMGEEQFGNLISWMLETIKSDLGSVERMGAAQGLAQVLGALGPQKLQSLFQDFVTSTHSNKFYVREGAMYVFSYLPVGMPRGFESFLPRVLPCVLGGLADDSEIVREVAMRAGQTIVSTYYLSAVDVLIPSLEEGLFSDNWRIRQSSVSLLGEFMAKVTGGDISESGTEDDSDRTARAKTDITKVMGEERVHSILAALYMIRFDVNTAVRQKTLSVWKSLVNNTPKTLREILPTLMATLISCMGSTNLDKRQVAARTLGDLVAKLGERVLPDIIPTLERGLDSKEKDRRLGVCVGLAEVISAAGKQQLGGYLQDVIPTVRKALQDRLPEVREAAAQAFDMLYTSVGPKVLDDVLPPLLTAISKESSAAGEPTPAGDALRQILLVRSQAVLPFLIPKLIDSPFTASNATALSSVASVAGAALNDHLSDILPVLFEAAADSDYSPEEAKEIKAATEAIILSIQDEGLDILIPELLQQIEGDEAATRAGAADLLASFCAATKADLEQYSHELIVSLLGLFNDSDEKVLIAAWNALGSITKTIKKENLSYLEAVDEGIEQVSDELPDEDDRVLPGFCIPKGLQPILPLLLNGLMLGSPEQRELSAAVLGQAIKLTSSDALRPFVVQITGPFIRVIADRFPWQVKSAILASLTLLIGKGAAAMKPFLPQLQTTFIKALHDPTMIVRKNAAIALGKLMALTVRIDPLLNELVGGIAATEGGVQEGMVGALRRVLEKAPANVDAGALQKVSNSLVELLDHLEENTRKAAAKTLGAYAKVAPADQVETFITSRLLVASDTWQARQGQSAALQQIIKNKPEVATKIHKNILTKLQEDTKDEKTVIRENAAISVGNLLIAAPAKSGEVVGVLATSDVALAALKATKEFAKAHPDAMSRHLAAIIPLVVARLKDKVAPVKTEAERVLLHALQVNGSPSVFKEYVATTDPVFNKYITDYVSRIIKKLNPESEEEDEDDDT